MKKSTILSIIIILLIVTIGMTTSAASNDNEIKVGNGYFTLPSDYAEGSLNKDGDIEINNKTNSIFLSETDAPLEECVSNYINSTESANRTVEQSTLNVDDIEIIKVAVDDGYTVHYWFTLDGNTFTIYSWDGNKNLDNEVKNLIQTAHT